MFEDALVTVDLEKELVALRVGHNVVDEDADLVPQTLVILLVALAENHLEGCFQAWDHLWVDRELVDGLLAANFDQVPESLNRQ